MVGEKRNTVFLATFLVCLLGYAVDIFDTFILSVVRVASLRDLGLDAAQITFEGGVLIRLQIFGILLGSFLWGSLADHFGRKRAVQLSILVYSLASLACGWVTSLEQYQILRFLAGLGLGGEMGTAITLILESAPQDRRGVYTAWIGGMGGVGAIMAGLAADHLPWRTTYILGGVLGLLLLAARVRLMESPFFKTRERKRNFLLESFQFFASRERLVKYFTGIALGLPIWLWLGVCVSFAPEIFKGAVSDGDAARVANVVFWNYIGFFLGDVASGYLAQRFQSRKVVLLTFMTVTLGMIGFWTLGAHQLSATVFAMLIAVTGFFTGYWVLFATMIGESFGSNFRAFAVTTAPQVLRFSAIPMTLIFESLFRSYSAQQATLFLIIGVILICGAAVFSLRETFGQSLAYND